MSKTDQKKLKSPYFRKRRPSVLSKLKQPYLYEQVEFGFVALGAHLHLASKMSAAAIPIFRVAAAVTPHFRDELNPNFYLFSRLDFRAPPLLSSFVRKNIQLKLELFCGLFGPLGVFGKGLFFNYTATLVFKDKISWKFSKLAKGDKAAITHLTEKVKDKLTHLKSLTYTDHASGTILSIFELDLYNRLDHCDTPRVNICCMRKCTPKFPQHFRFIAQTLSISITVTRELLQWSHGHEWTNVPVSSITLWEDTW
uniref:Uncharacterized protein n=1 Tax=Glossina austeni TaxID=7395 RepID=A0A1A9UIW5_GLOAU